MPVDVVVGLQWGDEGKGKIVDLLAPSYDVVARFQGGPNAGHTLCFNDAKYVLHTIPSGIFAPKTMNVIGNGVVLDPVSLKKEVDWIRGLGVEVTQRLIISKRAHLILPTHVLLDRAIEEHKGKGKVGSTLTGIGPAYTDKFARNGIRVGDLMGTKWAGHYRDLTEEHKDLLAFYEYPYDNGQLRGAEDLWFDAVGMLIDELHCTDTEYWLNEQLVLGKKILAEGAQGSLLDVDFGSYPYVTSSTTLSSGACTGLGVAPKHIDRVFGVFKAYCTRVGNGPFLTETDIMTAAEIRRLGDEYGATTGRPRRVGWLDLPALKYAAMLNGVTSLTMMKADVLSGFEGVKLCKDYFEGRAVFTDVEAWGEINGGIPKELSSYMKTIEDEVGVQIAGVSTGADRTKILYPELYV